MVSWRFFEKTVTCSFRDCGCAKVSFTAIVLPWQNRLFSSMIGFHACNKRKFQKWQTCFFFFVFFWGGETPDPYIDQTIVFPRLAIKDGNNNLNDGFGRADRMYKGGARRVWHRLAYVRTYLISRILIFLFRINYMRLWSIIVARLPKQNSSSKFSVSVSVSGLGSRNNGEQWGGAKKNPETERMYFFDACSPEILFFIAPLVSWVCRRQWLYRREAVW